MRDSKKARSSETVKRFTGDKRLSYFDGQLLSAADLRDEQQYLIRTRRRLNLALHGSGIITGLSVTVSAKGAPPSVVVEPGVALDRQGRELRLDASVTLKITKSESRYVVVEYAERKTDPVPSPTGDAETAMSRVEEGVAIWLWAEDKSHEGILVARLVCASGVWKIDRSFKPARCR